MKVSNMSPDLAKTASSGFDAQTDISSLYAIQWLPSQQTVMAVDCAVKLAELALAADRVFVPVPSRSALHLTDDMTLPSILRYLLWSERNEKGFVFDLRDLGAQSTAVSTPDPSKLLDPARIATWLSNWLQSITANARLTEAAVDWIARQPASFQELSARSRQKTTFHSWNLEVDDSDEDKLAKRLAVGWNTYDLLATSPIGHVFSSRRYRSAKIADRSLYIVLLSILIRSITYQQNAEHAGHVFHPHPLRMPIIGSVGPIADALASPQSPEQLIWRLLRPTNGAGAGLGCSIPLMMPIVAGRLTRIRRRLARRLNSPDVADRRDAEDQFIRTFTEDLITLHRDPAGSRLRADLAEIERTGSISGLRSQIRHVNDFVSNVVETKPLDIVVDVVDQLSVVSLTAPVGLARTLFRPIFAGILVEGEAIAGSVQRRTFFRQTKLSRPSIKTFVALALEGRDDTAKLLSQKGTFASFLC